MSIWCGNFLQSPIIRQSPPSRVCCSPSECLDTEPTTNASSGPARYFHTPWTRCPAQPSPAHTCRHLQFSIHETRPRQPWTRQRDTQNNGDGGGSAVGDGAFPLSGTDGHSHRTGAAASTPPGRAKSQHQAAASVSGYISRYRCPVAWRRTADGSAVGAAGAAAAAGAASGGKPRSAVRHPPFRIPAVDTVWSVSAPAAAASASGAYRRRQPPGGGQCCYQCRCTSS